MLSLNANACTQGSDSPLNDFVGRRDDNTLIINIEGPRKKPLKPDTKQPFRSLEMSVQLNQKIIALFCPHGGTVLDPFGGTLTTAIAATATNCECVVIEKDESSFNKAVQRLSKCVASKKNYFISRT